MRRKRAICCVTDGKKPQPPLLKIFFYTCATRQAGWYAARMSKSTDIQLSGPFKAEDASGRVHEVKAIRIFDEGYGVIDVYVDFVAAIDKGQFRDTGLIASIMARLKSLGYKGPNFSHADPVVQERKLIVLEAPEEFCSFAKQHGWKDLAEEFNEDE